LITTKLRYPAGRRGIGSLALWRGIRSPAFWLGIILFFSISLPVFGEGVTLSGDGGSLLVDEGHRSGYWLTSLSLNFRLPLYFAVSVGGAGSDFPAFNTDYTGVWLNAGVDTAPLGFDLSGAYLYRKQLTVILPDNSPISSEGAEGYFLRLALPLRLGDWKVNPSVLYGQGNYKDGDFYWFFGKPDVPSFLITGLSAAYQEKHFLYFYYLSLEMNILSPANTKLFESHFDAFTAAYRFSLEWKPFRLSGTSGWLFTKGKLDGTLSSDNQQYLWFPYNFYKAGFNARLHAPFAALQAEYRRDIFLLRMIAGAVHIFYGDAAVDIHSKEKELSFLGIPVFKGEEDSSSRFFNLAGIGAAFLSINAGLESVRVYRGSNTGPSLSLGIRKTFAVPWGYEALFDSGSSSGGEEEEAAQPAKALNLTSILLSGVSFYCSLTW
jgi:hypothetical protein